MAKRMKIDELNILNNEQEASFDYKDYIEHYFDPMQISEKQKRERIEEAEELFDAILLFLIWCEENPENVQREDTKREMENLYKEVIFQKVEPDDFIDIYVQFFIGNLVDVTTENKGDEYYTSVERAANVACNEANSVVNYSELQKAIEQGYTYKQWHTELDEKVRETHQEMEGVTIPIKEPFHVGGSLMMMPHDITLGANAKEIVNCRCSISYKNNYIEYDLQFFADKSKHAAYRQSQRKIKDEDIQDALDNPLNDPYNYFNDDEMGGTIKYIGKKVTVVVNAETGEHVTYFKTDSRTAKRLENGI